MLKKVIKELEDRIDNNYIDEHFALDLLYYLKKHYEMYDYLDQEILTRIRSFKEQNDIQRLQNQWERQILNKIQKKLVELMQ